MGNVRIRITAPLRRFTDGLDEVALSAESVGDALRRLCVQYPGLQGRIMDAEDSPRNFINIFVGKKNICALAGARTEVADGDIISLASPFSGG